MDLLQKMTYVIENPVLNQASIVNPRSNNLNESLSIQNVKFYL